MAKGDVYVVHEKQGGWTVMYAEGKDFQKYGDQYYKAIRKGKKVAKEMGTDLVVNYKDGRTGRYYYKNEEL